MRRNIAWEYWMSCLSPPLSPWLVGPLTSYLCRLAKIISAWWLTYPSEKYESQLILLFPICGEKACSKPPTRYSNLCKSMKTHTTKTMQYLSLSLSPSLSLPITIRSSLPGPIFQTQNRVAQTSQLHLEAAAKICPNGHTCHTPSQGMSGRLL